MLVNLLIAIGGTKHVLAQESGRYKSMVRNGLSNDMTVSSRSNNASRGGLVVPACGSWSHILLRVVRILARHLQAWVVDTAAEVG